MVAYRDQLYRIGGMSAHDQPGSPRDLVSVTDFAGMTRGRTPGLTSRHCRKHARRTMPSSLVTRCMWSVAGRCAGGDSTNAEFLDTALVFDLNRPERRWENLPTPPFRRRALAAASIKEKVYVLGGLTENGKVVKAVDLYDPARHAWSRGPELPGDKLQGFGPSAFGVGERLYFSGADGLIHRLNESGDGWEVAGKLTIPRLTHRLLPGIEDDLLAVGGNHARSPVGLIESIPLASSTRGPK